MRRLLLAAALVLLDGAALSAPPTPALRLGVLAFRPKPQVRKRWQPLATYLEGALGRAVELRVYDHMELAAAAEQRAVDVVATTPAQAIMLQHAAGLSTPLVTLISGAKVGELNAYGGVIFARAERADLETLADLAGRRVAVASVEAFGGYLVQIFELAEAGVPLPQGDRLLHTGLPQDLVVEAVLAGRADVGFVRSGVLEAMVEEGKLDLSKVKVINRQTLPAFPYAVSTRLYPEWPIAVLPQVDGDLASQLAAALLSFPHDSLGSDAELHGFTVPATYDGVARLLKRLRLPPFDRRPEITLSDLWDRYAVWISALAGLVVLLAGAIAGLVALNRTVRRTAGELASLNANLEDRVRERTAELELANKDLAELSYSVSHDLRSPLRAIAGFAEILGDEYAERLDAEGRRMVRVIQDAGIRMGRLLDGMLEYMRLSRHPLAPGPLDMAALVEEAYTSVAPPGRAITFAVADLPPAFGDEVLIREVLLALLSNAVRFTASSPEARIEVAGRTSATERVYSVRDNGIGFDMRFEAKLFRVFERLHTEGEATGTGMGLAIVKRIVQRHGGRAWAEGRPGEGATFYFSLPVAPPERAR